MNKAREIILRLLSEGKITIEEAEELLDAVPNEKIGRTRFTRTPKNVEIPIMEKEPKHDFNFNFHFPWDDPNWKWPWEEEGWQWPWESPKEENRGTESSFPIENISSLSIKCGDGNISVLGSSGDDDFVRINSDEEAIKSVLSADSRTRYINLGDANAEIVIPNKVSSLQVSKNDGDISISDLKSNIDLKSDDGNIAITRVNGDINVSMNDGNLMIRDVDSESVILKCDDVNILIDNITAKDFKIRMNDGMFSMDTTKAITEGYFNIIVEDGRISLSLPADSKFRVVASVEDGIIRHNLKEDVDKRFESLEVQHTENEGECSLSAIINSGGAEFSLSLNVGEIDIQVQ